MTSVALTASHQTNIRQQKSKTNVFPVSGPFTEKIAASLHRSVLVRAFRAQLESAMAAHRCWQQTKIESGIQMNKKPPVSRFSKPKAGTRSADQTWHNGADAEICLYARSLQKAAKTLVEKLELDRNARTDWDACPVVLLYRQAVELHLKALVGEGSNFLPSPTDSITLYKTHSLRWLAQIVGQIIKAVKWESEFKCEGVSSLDEFNAIVNELEALDPVSCAVQSGRRRHDGSVPHQLQPSNVVQFAKKLDALLDLLDATADALAATWDQQAEVSGEEDFNPGDDFEPTIH